MERLTAEYTNKNGVVMHERKDGVKNQQLIDKVAEYELLGYTPEQIRQRLLNEEDLAYICAAMSLLQEYLDKKHSGCLYELPCKIGDTVWFIDTECESFDCMEYGDHCHIYCDKHKKPAIKSTVIKQFRIKGNKFDSMTDTDAVCSSYEHTFYFTDIGKKVFVGENAEKEAKEALERILNGQK